MNILDFIILGLILVFGLWGFLKGFLQAIGGFIGLLVATILAGQYYGWMGNFFGDGNLALVGGFIVLFLIIWKLVSLIFYVFGKVFQIITVLPFLETFNRTLGALLGLAVGILIMVVLLSFLNKFPVNDWFTAQMVGSIVSKILLNLSFIFKPLLPNALNTLKGII